MGVGSPGNIKEKILTTHLGSHIYILRKNRMGEVEVPEHAVS